MSNAPEVSDFYNQNRDYWLRLSHEAGQTSSFMLNFGHWPAGVGNLHAAQHTFAQRIQQQLPVPTSAQKGLEIGCGIGGISIHLLQMHAQRHMTGVDISTGQLLLAQHNAKLAEVSDRFHPVLGNSMALPLDAEQFDFSVCIESSFHYSDKGKFFQENHRALRPGGLSVVADITCLAPEQIRFRKGNHFESAQCYTRYIEAAGFEVLSVQDIGPAVYAPLYEHVKAFNLRDRERSQVSRYWSLVLSNYRDLSRRGLMGYHIFTLRKPGD